MRIEADVKKYYFPRFWKMPWSFIVKIVTKRKSFERSARILFPVLFSFSFFLPGNQQERMRAQKGLPCYGKPF